MDCQTYSDPLFGKVEYSQKGVQPCPDSGSISSPECSQQPVTDSEVVEISPECLLPSQPLRDHYSSDDSSNMKEAGLFNTDPVVTYSGSDLTLTTLTEYFSLVFDDLDQGHSSEDHVGVEIPEILEHLVNFVTNGKHVSGHAVTELVLQSAETAVGEIYHNTDLHIDFKEPHQNKVPRCRRSDSSDYKSACGFLEKLVTALYVSGQGQRGDPTQEYRAVRSCVRALCALTADQLIDQHQCVNVLTSTMPAGSVPGTLKTKTCTSRPDLVLTSSIQDEFFPGIPFEVFSPVKRVEETRKKSFKKKRKTPVNHNNFSCNASFKNVKAFKFNAISNIAKGLKFDRQQSKADFLQSAVPVYKCETSQPQLFSDGKLKDKLLTQHVLQILGVASSYCYRKKRLGELMQKSKVFVGFLVCNEYLYITTLRGDESRFADFKPGSLQFNGNLDQIMSELVHQADPNIHVHFSPVELDLSVHRHRTALLIFLEYYIIYWHHLS